MFEISKPAVNQSRRGGSGTASKIALFDQQHFQPAHRSVTGYAGAVNAAADDDHIEKGFVSDSHHIVSAVHCLRQHHILSSLTTDHRI
jgi:hypothetical protein